MNQLENRMLIFSKSVRAFIYGLPKTLETMDDYKQVLRSSGSVGANYIEANESLGKKDLLMRLRISRKEAKETIYWLNIIQVPESYNSTKNSLIKEAMELRNILSSIITKCK